MKKIIIFSFFTLFAVRSWAGITYSLSYDAVSDKFTVSFVSTISYPPPPGLGTSNIGPSQCTIVFSASYNTAAIVTTGINGGSWIAQDKVTGSVGSLNGLKVVGFQTTGASIHEGVVAGTSYPAFTFTFGAGLNCGGTLRLFVDATDPADPNGAGGDFRSYLDIPPPTDYLSANSDATMQNCSTLVTLPFKFSYFTADKKNADAILSWIVQNQDFNATHYDVERSYNGVDFTAIASVPALSNPGNSATYNYPDANVFKTLVSGLVFYRIKKVDADGSFIYSDIKNPKLSSAIAINLYPNPTTTSHAYLTVDMQNSQTIYVSITDAAGKQVNKLQIDGVSGYNMTRLNVSPLPKGTYMVNVKTGTYSQTLTLVKQ